MNSQIISKEGTSVKLSFDVTPEKFEEGMKYSYNKNKSKISVPGFRKGKVPRKVVEAQYGVEFLYEDAVNWVLNEEYPNVIEELQLDVVSMPEIDVKEVGTKVLKLRISHQKLLRKKSRLILRRFRMTMQDLFLLKTELLRWAIQ